jgi:hypothetical protein
MNSTVVVEMLVVRLLGHRRFDDVIVGGDAAIVRELGQPADVLRIRAGDAHVEEHGVPVAILLPNQMVKVGPDGRQRLRRPGFTSDGVDRDIDGRDSGVSDAIDDVGFISRPLVGNRSRSRDWPRSRRPCEQRRPQQDLAPISARTRHVVSSRNQSIARRATSSVMPLTLLLKAQQ